MAPTIKISPRPVFLFVAVGEVVAFAHGADSGQMRQAIRWDLLIYISYVMYMVVMVVMVVTVIRDCGQSFVSVAGSLITRTTLFFLLLHCVFLNLLYTHTTK